MTTELSEELDHLFMCPITLGPIVDPVVAIDGYMYERSAIRQWFQHSSKSPITGLELANRRLVSVHPVKSAAKVYNSRKRALPQINQTNHKQKLHKKSKARKAPKKEEEKKVVLFLGGTEQKLEIKCKLTDTIPNLFVRIREQGFSNFCLFTLGLDEMDEMDDQKEKLDECYFLWRPEDCGVVVETIFGDRFPVFIPMEFRNSTETFVPGQRSPNSERQRSLNWSYFRAGFELCRQN